MTTTPNKPFTIILDEDVNDHDWKFIGEYRSEDEAKRKVQYDPGHIDSRSRQVVNVYLESKIKHSLKNVLSGKTESAGLYKWEYI